MKKFLLTSVGIQVFGIILLSAFVILPHWYFGLGRKPQLIMEFSLLLLLIGQITASIIWTKKYSGNFIIGILPTLITFWYYIQIARPLIIAYM